MEEHIQDHIYASVISDTSLATSDYCSLPKVPSALILSSKEFFPLYLGDHDSTHHTDSDNRLRKILDTLSESDGEYWAFRNKAVREHAHAYFQYPAMMVPQMQAELIRAVAQVNPSTKNVYDPFMGSGTVLGEAMTQGLGFGGCDINPFAVLLSRAKTGPFRVEEALSKAEELNHRISGDSNEKISVEFPGRDKWFRSDVSIALSKIRRAIIAECDLWFRRFLWVALAETVRLSSNSRTSTYKLHTRTSENIIARELNPIGHFKEILKHNITNMGLQRQLLEANGIMAPFVKTRKNYFLS